jgi:hypothetical protein
VIKILSEEEGTENSLSPPEQIHRLLSQMRDIIETFDSALDVMLKPKATRVKEPLTDDKEKGIQKTSRKIKYLNEIKPVLNYRT